MTTGYILKVENLTEDEIRERLWKRTFSPNGYEICGDIDGSRNDSYSEGADYLPRVGLVVWFHGPGSNDLKVWQGIYREARKALGDIRLTLVEKTRCFGDMSDRVIVEESDERSRLVQLAQAA